MPRFRYIPLFAVCFACSLGMAQDDELFSEVQPGAAFASPDDKATPVSTTLKSGAEIREILKKAGFEAKATGSLAASTEKEIDRWTIPVLVSVSEDEEWIEISLGLRAISDIQKELTAENLLKLMQASQEHSPARFCYRPDRKRTEVGMTLRNQDLSASLLRGEINRLAIAARKTSDLWASEEQKTPAIAEKTPKATLPANPPVSPAKVDLTGKWVASKSKTEAFAIEFQTGGKFNLVYINSGQQTKSSGTFQTTADSLTLNGQNLKLQGKLALKSAAQFEFTPVNQTALTFVKAK